MKLPYDNSSVLFPPPPYQPFGIKYGEWAERWWKWLTLIPTCSNPAFDETGDNCKTGQMNKYTWFLAGTFGGISNRKCLIPRDKALFLPVINFQSSLNDLGISTEKEMISFTKSNIDDIDVNALNASVDNMRLEKIEDYRVNSMFYLDLLHNNVLKNKSGSVKVASDGYWLFLRPLSPGLHYISFSGSCNKGLIHIGTNYEILVD
jgi:hypothetical protein